MKYIYVIFLLILILIISLFILKLRESSKMSCYLNYNSTYISGGSKKRFNPSDIGYEEVKNVKIEELETKEYIKEIINAPADSHVIFTSGATESMATVLNWVKNFNRYGVISGSKFDHNSVKSNCDNLGLKYKEYDIEEILNKRTNFNKNSSCIFLTHVSPHTGEIMPMDELKDSLNNVYLEEIDDDNDEMVEIVAQYKPIVVLDVSQSIGKVKIDMAKWGVNALFFSLHKLGGELNCGVLVVKDTIDKPFKPLIAGKQQGGLRGGTYNAYAYLNFKEIYEKYVNEFDHEGCKKMWDNMYKKLTLGGLDVVEPKFDHLHNTILIKTKKCSFDMIMELNQYGIYTSGKTACDSLDENDKESNLRLSFIGDGINNKTINKIIDVVNKHENKSDDDSE